VFDSGADQNGAAPFLFYICLVHRVLEPNDSKSEYSLSGTVRFDKKSQTWRLLSRWVPWILQARYEHLASPVHLHPCAATESGHRYLADVLQWKEQKRCSSTPCMSSRGAEFASPTSIFVRSWACLLTPWICSRSLARLRPHRSAPGAHLRPLICSRSS
jgi:hypothetical protein